MSNSRVAECRRRIGAPITSTVAVFRWLAALVVIALAAAVATPLGAARAGEEPERDESSPALATPFQVVEDRAVDDRLPQPEDRYALAGGCYTIEVPGRGFVARDGEDLRLTSSQAEAEPVHLQATRLGQYLLATREGRDDSVEGAWWDERGFLGAEPLLPEIALPDIGVGVPAPGEGLFPRAPWPTVPTTDQVIVADAPSEIGDWEIVAAGDDPDARVPGTDHDPDDGGDARPTQRPQHHPGRGTARGADRRPEAVPGKQRGRDDAELEWQTYVLSLPATGQTLGVEDGELRLVGRGEDAVDVAFHLVDEEGEGPDAADCARWPEIETNTSGPPESASADPADEVVGFFESHVHGMVGGGFRCGQVWHPYGVEYALGDCFEMGNPDSSVTEIILAGRSPHEPVTEYDPVGWPTFTSWPKRDTLSHEQYYWRWLERAYHGGLRLTTSLLVANTAICELQPINDRSCNEMDAIRAQARRHFELQDYIDAQAGGPGEGWFRVVTSPAQAREAINAGRMAVVLGIETSELFDCREFLDQAQCTEEQVDQRLDEVYDMGVRQMQLVNKFDNALTGVTGDPGTTGLAVNSLNRYVTGRYWDMQTCPADAAGDDHDHSHEHNGEQDSSHGDEHGRDHSHDGHDGHVGERPSGDEHDQPQMNVADDTPVGEHEGAAVLANDVLEVFGATDGYVAPAYPEGPHCNSRGLSALGIYVLERMIDRGMIFDPDHMSALGQRQALDHIEHTLIPAEQIAAAEEGRNPAWPAIISSHSWANDVTYQRIYQLDGIVAPMSTAADGFVERWVRHRDWADRWAGDDYRFGLGFGADTNGLATQPGPRTHPAEPVDYATGWQAPIGGVTIYQHTSGVQTYDITKDGVSHYGLFADWLRELQLSADELAAERGGSQAMLADMLRGPEVYIQMWERLVYPGGNCVDDQSTLQREDVHALRGANLGGFLEAAGHPLSRDGAAYLYCVDDGLGGLEFVVVFFDDDGRVSQLREPGTFSNPRPGLLP